MNPIGPQKSIKSDSYRVTMEKILEDGGEKRNYGFNGNGGKTKHIKSTEDGYKKWQGKVKGAIKHTYGVDGENDND